MLSKEECEVCLNQFIEDTNYYMGDKIFNDHEEEIDILQQLIKEHFEPQAYKREDLKANMVVCDRKFNEIALIVDPNANWPDCIKNKDLRKKKCIKIIFFGDLEFTYTAFEENRFFPVQMANLKREVEL
ncbi:hypothetical protein [Clostridium sp.]|uniref:hypothetical protein n=1 Tax=Clostridium sp. TaxID=1506 RepID=UPI002902CA52|nr:hypothetical protein [Clostridium sp.]MDU2158436.1 hypothetical protein [Clostridium sp.]